MPIHNIEQRDTFAECGYCFEVACTCGDFTVRLYGQPTEMTAERVLRQYDLAHQHRNRAIGDEVLASIVADCEASAS